MIGSQYIKATIKNLKFGHIVIRYKKGARRYGPIMICFSESKQIKETGKAYCCEFKNNGLLKCKWISIDELARLLDHKLNRKLKTEEIFEY